VERVVPDHAPTSGGITITIFGTNFGQLDHVVPEVLIGDALCTGACMDNCLSTVSHVPPPTQTQCIVCFGLVDGLWEGGT
jgi:hypothetical protein